MFLRAVQSLALLLGGLIAAAAAAHESDAQSWGSVTASTALAPQWEAHLEYHLRYSDDQSQVFQRLLRPGVTYRFNDIYTATAGLVHARNDTARASGPSDEYRFWQQFGYRLWRSESGLQLTGRTRLEQRWVESASGTGWRLRQQVRAEYPLALLGDGYKAVGYNETFLGLNATDWGQRQDVDRVRHFVGLRIPLTGMLQAEPGYMNQWVVRPGADAIDHIAALNLHLRF